MLKQFADGFHRVAWAVLGNDGISAAGTPTRSTNSGDQVEGVVQFIPQSDSGIRITGIEASIDARMNYPRGLRLIVLSYPGDLKTLANLVTSVAEFGGYFNDSAATPFNDGLTLPDPTFVLGRKVTDLYAHLDYNTVAHTTLVANLTGMTPVTNVRSDVALAFGEERGAIQIEPRRSVAAIAVRVVPVTGNPLTVELAGASLRSVVRGYTMTAAEAQRAAFPGYTPQTPARHGNTLIERGK